MQGMHLPRVGREFSPKHTSQFRYQNNNLLFCINYQLELKINNYFTGKSEFE